MTTLVLINMNPYQGLKLIAAGKITWLDAVVLINMNPYQGLKPCSASARN